ncbi:carbon monoxide-induced hydrogenase [Caminibacter mediatlanticus]|uniref:Carbon monoxide-induced hydrogenase, large subunit n=1 Tax=Caminibacter mediatlanticus TB-2 TaxID=391592 RepID=A0AAI9AIJ4_9BACT|nr:carbon monoxide-induced hydrogenase [Caminibacter mediatlanticus]EDM24282.1 carbon monoxide-induced hydrogenase, large subunit [Caminibacter mediatlanticus TB-2]
MKKINIGPFLASLEEPIYFKLDVDDNEIVRDVEIVNGFVHRGLEALTMQKNFFQNLILTERLCALCSNNHPFSYCLALEKIAEIEVSKRADYLRVIADEVKRIASNMFNLSMLAHLVHDYELMRDTMDTREIMQDVKETIWGNRMDLSAVTIGGVKYNLDKQKSEFILNSLEKIEPLVDKLFERFCNSEKIKKTKGIGVLTKQQALEFGVSGPVARGSGINNDVRVKAPYAAYDELEVRVDLESDGDVYSRMKVRWYDIKNAIKILKNAINNLPSGPIHLEKRPHIPAGEATVRTEAPRGELIYYVKTDGGQKPKRMRWRVPTYMNFQALEEMIKGNRASDVVLILNSIDPCVSCTDR